MKNKQVKAAEPPVPTSAQIDGEQVESNGKKPHKVLNTVINVVLIIAIVVAAVCTYVSFVTTSGNGVPSILGLQLLSIQTDSMYPEIKPGDLIIDVAIKDPSTLRPKDVITYWTVINGERVLNTHRIENIYDGGGYLIFETKGDNNQDVDPLTVHQSELVGQYKVRIPGVGKVFDYLQTSTGFLIVVVIPVFVFFLYHLVQFFRVLFEYQNVKNRIKFEQERGKTEDMIAAHEEEQKRKDAERAALEAELREKLKAELLASMQADAAKADNVKADDAKADNVKADDAKTDDVKADDAKTDDVKADDAKTDDPKTDDVKADDAKTDDVKADDPKADNVKADDAKTDDVKADDAKTDNVKADDAKTDDVKADDAKTDDAKTDDVKADDAKTDDAKTDDPKTDDPKTDDPKTDDAKADESASESDDNAHKDE